MVSIDDLTRIWSWGVDKWWHFPIAITLFLVLLPVLYLGFFVRAEDRMGTLINWVNKTTSWLDVQFTSTDLNLSLVLLAIVLSAVTTAVVFTLIAYAFNKRMNRKIENVLNELSEEQERSGKLQSALDSITMAYRKKAGILEGSTSYGMGMSSVAEGSPQHLRSMGHEDLYERAKRLAKEAGTDI